MRRTSHDELCPTTLGSHSCLDVIINTLIELRKKRVKENKGHSRARIAGKKQGLNGIKGRNANKGDVPESAGAIEGSAMGCFDRSGSTSSPLAPISFR